MRPIWRGVLKRSTKRSTLKYIQECKGNARNIDDGECSKCEPLESALILAEGQVEEADGALSGHEGGILQTGEPVRW